MAVLHWRRNSPPPPTFRLHALVGDFLGEEGIDPNAPVSSLSVAQWQVVEIVRAL